MPDAPHNWTEDAFLRGLACAALSPGLRSILLADMPAADLLPVAATLAQMLEAAEGRPVVSVLLGAAESEDDLWGGWALGAGTGRHAALRESAGLLTGGRADRRLRLVIIPDLNRLSPAAARACVALMGADVAHLERHGQRRCWQPNLCWLASRRTRERGTPSPELGRVSPHLLDR